MPVQKAIASSSPLPHDEVELPAAHGAETVLDCPNEAPRDTATADIGMRGDVVQPAATAVESGERRRDDAVAL